MFMFGMPGPLELVVIVAFMGTNILLFVLPLWIICGKAGFPGWYSLAFLKSNKTHRSTAKS